MKPNRSAYFLISLFLLSSCLQKGKNNADNAVPPTPATSISFPFSLSEKTMLVNTELDNETEGHYLKVLQVNSDSSIVINLPANFYLNETNYTHWMIGWPTGKPFYDAANENLAEIKHIDTIKKQITLGAILRGNGWPAKGQRIVFWNKAPSGFHSNSNQPLIQPGWWKDFAGKSIEFGSILFDSTHQQWIMYVQEVDTTHVQIYAATSPNLLNWKPYNNGRPLFRPKDFDNTTWAGKAEDGTTPQTARMYSSLFYKDEWYFFLSGYGKDGQRHIGLITASDPLKGPFTIHEQPLLSPGNDYDIKGCFYPKVCTHGNNFLLYYDGVNASGEETVCLAESENLLDWKKYTGNPVLSDHQGWRSGLFTSEPNYVQASNDTVWLMSGGYKKYNTEFTKEDSLAGRMPKDTSIFSSLESQKGKHISGNVMDAQLGVFLSTDNGHHFKPHANNPVWLCNYSDTLQNDHLGGDFYFAVSGNKKYVIYQAKSETLKRYSILLREQ